MYRPSENQQLPVIVFYHGGGFDFNRMEHYNPMCSKLAAETGHAVVSVDYRLAPEHKFPVPVDEAIYAAQWVYDNAATLGFDPARITVAGESVGGNLAAIVAQQAIKRGTFSLAYQMLYGDVAGLPPALVITAEYDPLRDEGEQYGQKLVENGVQVTQKRYLGMIHLFYAMTDVFEDGHDVYTLINEELRKLQ
ncbi:alpha/beta hydrolase fold domain-containing protein [Paenibacillus sp. LMG 31460]|uniref:Alpha/beta hydrolase fold domain-containing protein n=1 Tax=Paenibacillus germinis TaxID=2654979 RepID=A0ABX1Z064_9BACL|nr:alpha/beta hydrolase fold domain-containing protein [Paenibacillus germinis]NOU85686.1 alpha/beta hydrolase fold domain-containing protein [Paenibacillus germinis]